MLNTEADTMGASTVHVAVAAIVSDGRVLISKRAKNVHQGGLWEFPGGKVELNEDVNQALSREIREELGVEILMMRPLIKLLHHYPDKTVLLDTQLITQYQGRQYALDDSHEQLGLEGQQVKWVKLEKLVDYQFPEANKAIIRALTLPDRYLISPDPLNFNAKKYSATHFLEEFAQNCEHSKVIQLRIKSSDQKRLGRIVEHALDIAQKKQVKILVNSSMLPLEKINKLSSGIHLNSHHLHDMSYIRAYRTQFPHKIIAASCHHRQDIEQANDLKLDFIVISPVKQTMSHPLEKPMGWEQFKKLTEYAQIPVFALGGLQSDDIEDAHLNGAQGIAAISSLWKTL